MRGTMVALLLGGLLTIGVGRSRADVIIYGTTVTNNNVTTLYTIDATTMAVSSGVTVKDPGTSTNIKNITATAFDNNGVLWAIGAGESGSGNELYTVNRSTGAATPIAAIGAAGNISSMAFAPGSNNLSFMTVVSGSGSSSRFALATITGLTPASSGTLIPVVATPTYSNGGNGLAYQPGTGTLYFANGSFLPNINPPPPTTNTSLLTLDSNPNDGSGVYGNSVSLGTLDYSALVNPGGVTPTSPGFRVPGMVFSPDGLTLYAAVVNNSPPNVQSSLAIIDLDPIVDPLIINLGFAGNSPITSLAIDNLSQVPEPGSLALLTAAAAGALGYRWRRRRTASPQPVSA
jgi:hypothetical protein